MAATPDRSVFEYRQLDSLDEVNRLAQEEGFELLQAVETVGELRYIVRRVREQDAARRAGFSAPAPE